VLVVYRLDRLARSSRDLLNIVHQVHAAGASFKSIKDAWADTSNSHGRLILTVLSGLAEFERELIAQRRALAELMKVVNKLEPGDVLMVTRLDRLARSTRDLLNLLNTINERGASFRSFRDAWADTTNAHGRLIITVGGWRSSSGS
jgi:DNA invertase Pin-like site-specific DNA recombinase